VQSSLIAERIRVLREKTSIPVFTFAEDVAASGNVFGLRLMRIAAK
jgi:ClpP class serine protease